MKSVSRLMARLVATALLAAAVGWTVGGHGFGPMVAQAQGTAPGRDAAGGSAFDVASIRRNRKADEDRAAAVAAATGVARAPGRARTQAGGILNGQAMTVRELIRDAYGYRNRALSDVTGGPSWLDQERYDVLAKTSVELPPSGMAGLPPEAERLLRKLLEDRFKLVVHTEFRSRPVYEMVQGPKGRPQPGLKPSDGNCAGFYGFSTSPAAPPKSGAAQGASGAAANTGGRPAPKPPCPFTLSGGTFATGNMTMEELARFLPAFPSINTTVIDKTGLKGGYDIVVKYQLADVSAAQTPEMASRPLFNKAFEDQLGLRLVKTDGKVGVLVVERVERPTEN